MGVKRRSTETSVMPLPHKFLRVRGVPEIGSETAPNIHCGHSIYVWEVWDSTYMGIYMHGRYGTHRFRTSSNEEALVLESCAWVRPPGQT